MNFTRAILSSVALLVLGTIPAVSAAQTCVVTYMDHNIDTTENEVQAWASVEDYFDTYPCFDYAYNEWFYWSHSYEATVDIESPTQNSAYDYDGQASVSYGGGSADAYAELSFTGDLGVYEIFLTILINCTVGGDFIDDDDDIPPIEIPIYAGYDAWPADTCTVTQGYSSSHPSIDIDASDWGADVYAMEDGTVVAVFDSGTPGGTANFVIIQGADDMYTIYAHVDPTVTEQQTVSAGQKIGEVDNTGTTTGSHVHITRSSTQNDEDGVDFELPDCP